MRAHRMRRDMGRSIIRQWKINRALYRQYGGRIIYQQLGAEPLDAYRKFLEERQTAGDFQIHGKAFTDTFWRYFTDESMHSFYERGSEEEARAFATPPRERAAFPRHQGKMYRWDRAIPESKLVRFTRRPHFRQKSETRTDACNSSTGANQ